MNRLQLLARLGFLTLAGVTWVACDRAVEPASASPRQSLVERFDEAELVGAVEPKAPSDPTAWRFDGTRVAEDADDATRGWTALHGVEDLRVEGDKLVGRTGEVPLLEIPLPAQGIGDDTVHAVEIRLRATAGSQLGVFFLAEDELDVPELVEELREDPTADLTVDLVPGDEVREYRLTSANAGFAYSYSLSSIRRLLLMPTDEAGAAFELESVRIVSRGEHLASVASGIGWHGHQEVYRESIVSRTPERVVFELSLPPDPFLDLAIATLEGAPLTFVVEGRARGTSEWSTLLRRTVTTPERWSQANVDLGRLGPGPVELALVLEAETDGQIGFWGGPVVRARGARPLASAPSIARRALTEEREPPQGVIVVLADTLRRDHLPMYGYARDTAPTLQRLAREGTLFEDAISQGTWTKVAATSLLTGLYGTTHGLADMSDRLPATVTTLAECFREAGYATFATSSVPFTGKLSNLHQGVDVFYERGSIDGDFLAAKTARPFADHLLPWLENVRDVPFFALLHVFDPHSPFEPAAPWNARWMDADVMAEHRAHMERVSEVIESDFMKDQALPNREEMAASGVDAATYVEREKIWYDASIRAMDEEIARLVERLEELGLAERTLIAVVSDHGEEFLEHGRHFHGYTAYGEMLNVPLLLWWPGVVPAGLRVEETVETIGLMPTLLGLSRIPVPAEVQGQDLLPLMIQGHPPEALGYASRPAFSERRIAPEAFDDDEHPVSSFVVIDPPWKLIRNTERPEGWPEFELYDHAADPLNLHDVAEANPAIVERLARRLATWREEVEAAAVSVEASLEELGEEDLEQLRALGYAE